MKRKSSFLGSILFAMIFTVVGYLAYKYITQPMAREAKASSEWPCTKGTIISSELKKEKNSDGKYMYTASILYRYEVAGKQYSSTTVSAVDGSTSVASKVKSKLRKYPEESKVDVFFDPEFPDSAMLEPGMSLITSVLLKLPLLFCVFGMLIFFSTIKRLLVGR